MKTFLLSLLIGATAFAQVSNNRTVEGTNTPGFSSTKNYVKNPNCAKNTIGITKSGGTLAKGTTTPLNDDSGSECEIDASSSGQTYTWALNTFGQGMKGQNCEARFVYEGDASLYKAYINNGATKITTDLQLESSTSGAKTVSINFPCGDLSAANTLVIESTSASAAAFSTAKVYGGLATNLSNVAQASFVGGVVYPAQTNCKWSSTAVIGDVTDADCTTRTLTGSAAAPSSTWPGLSFSNLPPGEYVVYATGVGETADAVSCNYGISDGTTTTSIISTNTGSATPNYIPLSMVGRFTYTTAQSSVNFRIKLGNPQATSTCSLSNGATTDNTQTELKVYRIPSSTELALNSNKTPWYINANLAGGDADLGTSDVASYTELTNSALTLTPVAGSAPVGVMCSGTNAAAAPTTSTSTCAAGNESLGINFDIPEAGTYRVCAFFGHAVDLNAASTAAYVGFQLVETATNAQTILQQGGARTPTAFEIVAGSGINHRHTKPVTNCGFFTFSSVGTKGIRLMYEQDVVGAIIGSSVTASAVASYGQADVRFEVTPVTRQIPMPLVVNSVTSNSSGLTRIEYATVTPTNGSTCTINSQSGSWLSSTTPNAAGDCTLTFTSGIFSSSPVCTLTPEDNAFLGVVPKMARISAVSSSSLRFLVEQIDETSAFASSITAQPFKTHIICMGQR